jgi:hypothetical protein
MLLQLSPLDVIFYSIVISFVLVYEVSMAVKKLILRIYYKWNWVRYGEFGRYNKNKGKIAKLRKPWDCMKCMTGWCALVLALLAGYNWESIVWCAVGLVCGAIFESIKLRWL